MTISKMRGDAIRLFNAGVAAADPYLAVKRALTAAPCQPGAPIIAVGKAARRMAEAALDTCTTPPRAVIIVTNPENAGAVAGATCFASSHPVPDSIGVQAAQAVEDLLEKATQGEQVLALISGGGSALLPAPVAGLTLDDKARVNQLLLGSGADITDMNLVRQQLSRLKGGGLLRVAAPAAVRALILSDVIGDDLRAIASGPTASPLGNRQDARAMLERYGIWDQVGPAVQSVLTASTAPAADMPLAINELVGSNTLSAQAMKAAMPSAILHADPLIGDVARAAERIAAIDAPGVHLFGGETTVVLSGDGKGGRNQEMALRVALALEGDARPWVYLQGGTDGRDGPTDAAGGLVCNDTITKIRAAGQNPEALLANNDAYTALKAGDALLMTGGTGTNVADLGIFIRA